MKQFMTWTAAIGFLFSIFGCAPVTIDSRPSSASVYDAAGQTKLGTTPYDTYILFSDKSIVIRKDRFQEKTLTIPFDAEEKMTVQLAAEPITLNSKPRADLFFDNEETPAGQTPMKVNVSGKARTATLKAEGFYDKTITLSTETPDPLNVHLERRPIVEISTRPAGVQVSENGSVIGTAPVTAEITEPRTFQFSKDGYFTKKMTLEGAPPYSVDVELQAFPEMTIHTEPAEAQVSLNGKPLGTAPVSLKVGEPLSITVSADRYYDRTVQLTPDSKTDQTVELAPMPYITVQSDPAGAELSSGGQSLGTAPVEVLVEEPMTIQAEQDGYQTAEITLSPDSSDETIKLTPQPAPVSE